MSDDEREVQERPGRRPRKPPGSGFRVPAVTMVFVGLAVGWAVSGWLGGVFGLAVGVLLWRSRA